MRISDWSSDVCSSDLFAVVPGRRAVLPVAFAYPATPIKGAANPVSKRFRLPSRAPPDWRGACVAKCQPRPVVRPDRDRKSLGEGESVSVRVAPGGARAHKKKKGVNSNIQK